MPTITFLASAVIPSRAPSRLLLTALLFALSSGCASQALSRWNTTNWPREVPQGLVVIETVDHQPACTGAVIAGADTLVYVLTARHCVAGKKPGHPVLARSVAIPELRGGTRVWIHLPATRALLRQAPSRKLHDSGSGRPPGDWAISDWAILEATAPGPIPVMSLASDEIAANLRPLDRVTLLSFFDGAFDTLYPHGHELPWGEHSDDFVQGGHSGGPVLSSGGLVAVFSGARVRFHILGFFALPGTLTFTSVETVRSEAARCGFAIDAPGARLNTAKPGECWLAVPSHD